MIRCFVGRNSQAFHKVSRQGENGTIRCLPAADDRGIKFIPPTKITHRQTKVPHDIRSNRIAVNIS
ncbi:hypothetical protein [Enterococcus lactis]